MSMRRADASKHCESMVIVTTCYDGDTHENPGRQEENVAGFVIPEYRSRRGPAICRPHAVLALWRFRL